MRKIRIVLKSGYTFTFPCEHMKVKTIDNQLVGYSFDNANVIFPIYIRMDDVSAVIDEGECSKVKQSEPPKEENK